MTQTRKLILLLLCLAVGQVLVAQNCTLPVITNVTASTPSCPGDQVTITVDGSLNDATQWVLYTGDCGDTQIATSTDGTFSVQVGATTTYYVKGEGGCVDSGGSGGSLIWEEQFDGGIPNTWTLSSFPTGADWAWSSDGTADDVSVNGSTYVARFISIGSPIQSPSVANGCAQFNSDAFAYNGTSIAGFGPFPAPHNSSMTSPSINCTGLSSVTLQFNQYFRRFASQTIVSVSNDGGSTWTDFEVNTAFPVITPPDDVQMIDISAIAGNQSDVKVRFTFSGNLYFWLVDDVQLLDSESSCASVVVEEVEECDSCEPTPITCPADITMDNEDGDCGAIVTFTLPDGATSTPTSGSFFPVGTTTVDVTGSDGCDGTSTCSFKITVNDTEKPSISCPSHTTVGTNEGECGADVHLPAPNANDNCGVTQLKGRYRLVDENNNPLGSYTSRKNDPSDYLAVGRYQVNWRAKDAAGKKRSCSYFLTVEDDEDPTAVCKDVTVEFNGEASIDLAVSQVWNEAASDDNCGTVYYVGTSPSLSISCADLGSVVPLTVTIRDEAGNTDNCTADVTVTGLPCGWSEGADDGSINCPGSTDSDYNPTANSFTISADGCWNNYNQADQAAYVYQKLCGDGTLTARVASINTQGYAGLMLRESLDPEARRAGALKNTSTRRVRREYRAAYGGIVTQSSSNRRGVEWFRITRKGNEVTSYTSTNGSSWRTLYRITYTNLADCVYLGMMAYSINGSAEVVAVFDNVSFSGSGSGFIDNNTSLPNTFTAFDTDQALEQPEVKLFPNPSNGQSQIELRGFSETPAQILVRDAFGKVVRQIEVDYPKGTSLPLDLQDMPAGLYLISVMQDQQQVITKKLMIQR
ncbi:MAG: HYR domain-containing protein [Saprospiraceae bacterium]|nr:HYR domain-containing protein [Saprospiraceae bacterium]